MKMKTREYFNHAKISYKIARRNNSVFKSIKLMCKEDVRLGAANGRVMCKAWIKIDDIYDNLNSNFEEEYSSLKKIGLGVTLSGVLVFASAHINVFKMSMNGVDINTGFARSSLFFGAVSIISGLVALSISYGLVPLISKKASD